jgi:dTDP-D-glucose 4,6-dehydratase
MLNIAINGSSGFIASNLIKYLVNKSEINVFAYTRQKKLQEYRSIKYKFCEIENAENLSNLDYIIYCSYNFNSLKNYNCNKLKILLEKTIYLKVRVIYISSCSASYISKSKYSKDKVRCENMIKFYNQTIIRVPTIIHKKNNNVFIGGQGKALNNLIIFMNLFKFFPLIGNGNFVHNYCMIEDFNNIIYLILDKKINEKFLIIKNTNEIKFKNLISIILTIKKLNLRLIPVPIIFLKIILFPTRFIKSNRISSYDSLIDVISDNNTISDKKYFLKNFEYTNFTS